MERKLKAQPRHQTGSAEARRMRAAGRVPAVVYGHGAEPLPVSVDALELLHLLHTEAGGNVVVEMRVDHDKFLAMPREVQRDHLRSRFIHVDFLRIAVDEKITVEVPVHVVGESRGVREGGVIEHHLWNLELECFPQDVPTSVEADITKLGIGDSLKVSDIKAPPKAAVLTSQDEVVVSVVAPAILRAEEGEAAEAEEGAEAAEAAEEGEATEGDES